MGEQLEKTGPRATPISTEPKIESFLLTFPSQLWELCSNPIFSERIVQTFGKSKNIPKRRTIPPEKRFQKLWGTSIKRVVAFKIRVKKTILNPNEAVTINGLRGFFEPAVLPIMTGNSGNTQGAKTVSKPAIKELIISAMFIVFNIKLTK